jgi:hypothetical protein
MADYAISNVPRRVVYAASGTGPYAFTFEILSQTDIAVYKASTLLTLTTDYTVTINANGTGSVTLVTSAGTSNITIVGAKNIQRTTDFTTGGDLFANTLNDELDNQTIFIQQVAETAERGLKAPVVDPTDINMTLPAKASRVGTVLAFNATTGNPEAGPSIGSVTTVAAQSANINTVATNIASVNTVAGNITNVNTVAGVSSNVTAVATNIANVNAVGSDLLEATSEINTVAVDIANVNTVGTNIASVNTVAGEIGAGQDVTVVAANLSGADTIGTVATNIANVNATGTNIANVNAVGADLLEAVSEINTVATDITNVNTVGTAIASVNTVAGISGAVSTVSGISANVTTVAGVSSNVTTVAGISSNVTTVAGISANVTSVAGNATNINAVAGNATNINAVNSNATNINTVAGIAANVTTVAGNSANVTIAATNVADINNFADVYQGAKATDPTLRNDGSALQSGDLYFNTTDDVMKVREAGAWLAAYASLSGALIAANNLSDVTSTSSARTNLGLGTGDSPTFTGVVTGAGTVSAPAITTTGDTNTGIFFPAADTIAFTEGGVESMRINASGNVGIGGEPTGRLALWASGGVQQYIISTSATSQDNAIVSLCNSGAAYSMQAFDALSHKWATQGTERMRITSAGDVGIGTTAPLARLTVSDSTATNGTMTLGNNASFYGGLQYTFSTGELRISQVGGGSLGTTFYTAGSERMRIDTSGNVGIGNTAPGAKLEVTGAIRSLRSGSTSAVLQVINDNNSWNITCGTTTQVFAVDNNLVGRSFYVNPDNNFVVNQNIGIGNTTPTTSGTGITFPATQSASSNANTLDDYEEGTYTPTQANFTITGTPTLTGRYIKIGKLVHFNATFTSTGTIAHSASAYVSLPFAGRINTGNITMRLSSISSAFNNNQSGAQCTTDEVSFDRFFVGSFTTTSTGQSLYFAGTYETSN